MRMIAAVIALVTFFLASWIVIPAWSYSVIALGVGAREISAWLVVSSLVAVALALPSVRESRFAGSIIVVALVSLALSVSPFVRLPAAVNRFDNTIRTMSATPRRVLRSKPLSVVDLFRGIRTDSVHETHGVPFANPNGHSLTLDVYQPRDAGSYPIIVQIYGGAWQRGEPDDNANFARLISSAGYVVFAIDYRHAPAVHWPVLLDDVDASLAWIRDHAASYGGDTARVVLMGRSAGGHLALMAAYSSSVMNIRSVVSFYGPTDLPSAYRDPPHPDPIDVRATTQTLMGGPLEQMPEQYASASPITYATKRQPPTLLIYGGADKIVEARWGAKLRDQLVESGTPVAYLEIPWANHAFDAVFNGPSSQLALYYTERFLAWSTSPATNPR